ncbi:MAG: aminoacyl-tRNA hydrolase [Oscillospiraceae bacterium]|jgi:PTH1 family peptidyl-tRNA hydrolase|nr:aminoacyl-tRNA hydrolase [Oscillospiraceae bacterium]
MPLFTKRHTGVSYIVVFLGNPGARYNGTRHNAGYMCGDALSKSLGIKIDRLKHKSLTARAEIGGAGVLLMKPQTYMNLSGEAAADAMRYYKVPPERLLAVSDDIALPLGKLRVRRDGSAGGHNGLRDISEKCGGDGFPRVRIGVGGKPNAELDTADWVLSAFTGFDRSEMERAAARAADCVRCIIEQGLDAAMQKYN